MKVKFENNSTTTHPIVKVVEWSKALDSRYGSRKAVWVRQTQVLVLKMECGFKSHFEQAFKWILIIQKYYNFNQQACLYKLKIEDGTTHPIVKVVEWSKALDSSYGFRKE